MMDYRWSLVYVGKTREYQLSESVLVDGEWVKVLTTNWATMEAATTHMRAKDGERRRDVL